MLPDLSTSADLARWLLAFTGASVVAIAAFRMRSLSRSGAITAVVLGTVLVGAAGWWAGALLITFFATSSALSRIGRVPTEDRHESRRNASQVLANGGVALVCALGYGWAGHHLWLIALAGSLAAANADTWSTEVGRTSPSLPRMVTSGRRVPAGTSGAVSGRGLVAALAGSLLIGLIAAIGSSFGWYEPGDGTISLVPIIGAAGLGGSLLDSLLGATVQDTRWCETCTNQTEHRIHRCGNPSRSISGISWISNDVVNLACATGGAVIATALGGLLT